MRDLELLILKERRLRRVSKDEAAALQDALTAKLITIRRAIEDGAARLVRRVRVIQRHHALALADEYARSHPHRRFIADDDARMRRQARSRAVGPDDGIARQQSAPSVIAGHVHALAGAGLRQR